MLITQRGTANREEDWDNIQGELDYRMNGAGEMG